MSEEQFNAFLEACRVELEQKQTAFFGQFADDVAWSFDIDQGTFSLNEQAFPMTPIGSFSEAHQTWLWAWANDSFPDAARDASRQLQSLYKRTGFRVFADEAIKATADEAEDLATLANHELGAVAEFRYQENGLMTYIAVLGNGDITD